MNQEFAKRNCVNDMQEQPPRNEPPYEEEDICILSQILNACGIVMIILGAIGAYKFSKVRLGYFEETDSSLVFLYIVGGVITALLFFSLAVIVDACDKYRSVHKN